MDHATPEQEQAFLSALRDEPGNILHRRVFADWLEEQGDARAGYYRALADTMEAQPLLLTHLRTIAYVHGRLVNHRLLYYPPMLGQDVQACHIEMVMDDGRGLLSGHTMDFVARLNSHVHFAVLEGQIPLTQIIVDDTGQHGTNLSGFPSSYPGQS